jgi:GNAT superfamily N-acetyltransferase
MDTAARFALRPCAADEFAAILAIINDGAEAYRGVIPDDRWHDPYMPAAELRIQLDAGVAFWGAERAGVLLGVMGLQPVADVLLIRHAYVAGTAQRSGAGSALMAHIRTLAGDRPLLVGTWRAATWAIAFYRKHGFAAVPEADIAALLNRYWSIPARQVETSVVLADARWFARGG